MKGMKGLELPLNMIVLIIIAVLVLLVIGVFFTSQTTTGFGTISDAAALERGCQILRANNCPAAGQLNSDPAIPNYRPGGALSDVPLSEACRRNGYDFATTCRTHCVCPA